MAESTARRRANGEGYLKHDPKRDRWRGAVAWTDPDGTPRRKAFSGKTRTDVRRRMDELRAELAEGRAPASGLSVADYLAGWLEAERARVRPSTWRYREGHVRVYIVPAVGSMKLGALAPRDVERMTAGMVERGLAPRTAAGCRTTLRKALSDALRDGLVHRNVAALARPPRIPGRDVEYLNRDELRRLLDACEGEPIGPLVTLAATTGLRQGELRSTCLSGPSQPCGLSTRPRRPPGRPLAPTGRTWTGSCSRMRWGGRCEAGMRPRASTRYLSRPGCDTWHSMRCDIPGPRWRWRPASRSRSWPTISATPASRSRPRSIAASCRS